MNISKMNTMLRHIWSEPRFAAEVEWGYEYGLSSQLRRQVPREELEGYAVTGQHARPERVVSFVRYEEPDWDWWEPTSQWRRVAARERELDALLAK